MPVTGGRRSWLIEARNEADLAGCKYDAVDPAKCLVAGELERRWYDRLAEVCRARKPSRLRRRPPLIAVALGAGNAVGAGDDTDAVWRNRDASAKTRKAIVRAVIKEIVVPLADGRIDLLLRCRGGDHTRLGCRVTEEEAARPDVR